MVENTDELQNKVQIFGGSRIRSVWDADEEKWYFMLMKRSGIFLLLM